MEGDATTPTHTRNYSAFTRETLLWTALLVSKMRFILFASLLIFAISSVVVAEELLSVHLIAHSHCDPGWLMTDREYYDRDVKHILNGVFDILKSDPTKRFNWAEISFFDMWWVEQSDETKEQFKKLVKNGQLEFIGGGIVQNDEAASSIDAVINQVTDGHEYIKKHFGTRPRIAWQIDPFGHSTLTPFLFAEMGYEAMIINRINHRLKGDYKENRNMEFIWNPSPSLGSKHEIFTHILYAHYSAPNGFDWESYSWEGGKESINSNNVDRRSRDLTNELKNRARAYRTKSLLVTWGDDFKFKNTRAQFDNMDQLVKHINQHPEMGVKIQYSTPSTWFDELKQNAAKANVAFPTRTDEDFFPYADNDQSYWVGYYTSRPVTKVYHRHSLSTLRAAEITHLLAKSEHSDVNSEVGQDFKQNFNLLAQAGWESDIFAHHDGITGTAKDYVMANYLKRLESAVEKSEKVMAQSVSTLLKKEGKTPKLNPNPRKLYEFGKTTDKNSCFPLVASNSLGWPRVEVTDVMVDTPNVHVLVDGKEIVCQTTPVYERDGQGSLKEESELKKYQLYFEIDLKALASKTYFLCAGKGEKTFESEVEIYSKKSGGRNKAKVLDGDNKATIQNHFYKLNFDGDGFVSQVETIAKKTTEKLSINFMEYHIGQGGAYIMITWGDPQGIDNGGNSLHIYKGPLVHEANTYFMGKNTARVRLYNNNEEIDNKYIDITHVSGTSNVNREFLVRYSTDLKSGKTFYTDNGFKMMPRIRLDRKEERFYPLQTTAFLQDEGTSRQMTVLSSSVSGCTSNAEGALEIILHRSCGQDDGRGLGEAMRDGSIVYRRHWLLLESAARTETRRQQMQLKLEHPIRIVSGDLVNPSTFSTDYETEYSPMGTKSLPRSIHLNTFKARDSQGDQVVLRLRHINEGDASISVPLNDIFDQTWELNSAVRHGLSLADWAERPKLEKHASDVLARINNDVLKVHRVQAGDKQNSDEDGVFLSDDALRKAKELKEKAKEKLGKRNNRELLEVDGEQSQVSVAEIFPLEIQTFVGVLEATPSFHKSLRVKFGEANDEPEDEKGKPLGLDPIIKKETKNDKDDGKPSENFVSVKVKPDKGSPNVKPKPPLRPVRAEGNQIDRLIDEEESGSVSKGEMRQLVSLTLFGVALLLLMFVALQGRRLKSWFVAPSNRPSKVSHRRN
eukprot:TRINITY_DN1308_c0_g1_i1.p1 TRINITY_DN1308_c0_g1~~TRINITY_DN1308_c0_g1_i1.p1  ORF type:complete len:1186 (+),score=397.13 TRINITY_DN1308_c0_g1_i1:18-3575(+)